MDAYESRRLRLARRISDALGRAAHVARRTLGAALIELSYRVPNQRLSDWLWARGFRLEFLRTSC